MSEESRSLNGWERWREYVLAEQRRMNNVLLQLVKSDSDIEKQIAVLLENRAYVSDLSKLVNEKLLKAVGDVEKHVAVLLETKTQVADLTKTINEKLVPNQRELFVRVGVLASGISIGLSTVISLAIWFFTNRP